MILRRHRKNRPGSLEKNNERKEFNATIGKIPIAKLLASEFQSRLDAFEDEESDKALAASIESQGLLEVPKVRRCKQDKARYEVISGHRRVYVASRFLHWKEITCEVYDDLDDKTAFGILLAHNLHWQRMSPYEEGFAYSLFKETFRINTDGISSFFHVRPERVDSQISFRSLTDQLSVLLDDKKDKLHFQKNFTRYFARHLSKLNDREKWKIAAKLIADADNPSALANILFNSRDDELGTAKDQCSNS